VKPIAFHKTTDHSTPYLQGRNPHLL